MSKLIGLEILSLQEDYKHTIQKIETYEGILGSSKVMFKTIKKDLAKIKQWYGLPRKTEICNAAEAVFEESPVVEQDVIFAMNRFGYVKMIDLTIFDKNEAAIREENRIILSCRNTSRLCIFTQEGNLHQLKMLDVPLCRPKDKGIPIENICNYDGSKESICFIESWETLIGKRLLFVTKNAMVKQVPSAEFETIKKTVVSTKLTEQDRLFYIGIVEKDCVALLTTENRILKFNMVDISVLKKASVGVRGMKLQEGEELKEVFCVDQEESLIIKPGRKKRVNLSDLKLEKTRCETRTAIIKERSRMSQRNFKSEKDIYLAAKRRRRRHIILFAIIVAAITLGVCYTVILENKSSIPPTATSNQSQQTTVATTATTYSLQLQNLPLSLPLKKLEIQEKMF